jgi:hypothetical protein
MTEARREDVIRISRVLGRCKSAPMKMKQKKTCHKRQLEEDP